MKVLHIEIMPYRYLDLAEARKHRSAWVVLPNSLYDPEKGAELYDEYIDLLVDSERLGFDGILRE